MATQSSHRRHLPELQAISPTHAGLWLDKYMAAVQIKGGTMARGETDPRQDVLQQAAALSIPTLYKDFYARWRATLAGLGATCKLARSQGRIAIGLGGESVQETAITLHRTYGVPYLPGSALKGLAARFAAQRLGKDWQKESEAYLTVFGNTRQAGYITFFDAYPDPASGPLLRPDIMAIHHPKYYQGENAAPADWDDPSLVPFPTATGCYLVALGGPRADWAQAWVDKAFLIVGYALETMGVGAKTSSGYGRMTLEGIGPAEQAERDNSDPAGGRPHSGESYVQAKRRLLKEEKAPAGRQRGTVNNVIHRPGGDPYGFITPAAGGGDVHVYESQLNPPGELRKDQIVEFTLLAQTGGAKRPSAQAVTVLRQPGD